MKRNILCFTAGITALFTIAGFFLPHIVSSVFDCRQETETSYYKTGEVQLLLADDASLANRLTLVSSGYNSISLTDGTNLSEDEAYAAVLSALALLSDERISIQFPEAVTAYSLSPFLALPRGGAGISAVFWHCSLADEAGNSMTMVLDDDSGKLLSFSLYLSDAETAKNSDVVLPSKQESSYLMVKNYAARVPEDLAEAFGEYYGFAEAWGMEADADESGLQFYFEFTAKDGTSCNMSLFLFDSAFFYH